jgi:hypothetical protein
MVVAEPGLVVSILPREPHRHGGEAGDRDLLAEWIEHAVPHRRLARIGHLLRGAKVVGVDVEQVGGLGAGAHEQQRVGDGGSV